MPNLEFSRRNNYRSAMKLYTDGSSALQPEIFYTDETEEQRLERERRARAKRNAKAKAQAQKVAASQKRITAALVSLAAIIVVCFGVMTLSAVTASNALTNEISSLEAELAEIVAQNDSIEYDIESAVDLNTIISVAENELGMVRSSSDRVITYKDSDQEYVQQVAEVPAD